ncbi:MAG: NACHT domain-containing protein [Bryobacteraceae bacterium]
MLTLLKPFQGFFSRWKFDPATAFVTVVIAPLGILLLKALAKHTKIWFIYLVDGVLYWLSRVVLHSLAARLTLRKYCSILLDGENRYLHVPSQHDIKLSVDTIFVTLHLEHHGGEKEAYTHGDLLELSNRVRVMGDPGSGKTSLAKRILRDQCRLALTSPSKARLPVFMELKTLNIPASVKDKALGRWLLDHIRSIVTSVAVYKIQECFDAYCKTSGLLLLLDGLDEVSKSQYPRVSRAIQALSDDLAAESKDNAIVLTMRTQFYQQIKDEFRDAVGQAVFVRPFTPTDIFEFLSRWPFKANKHSLIPQIYSDLTDRPTLREMCSNPLILAMYVAEYETSDSPLAPESRTEFYNRVTEELVIKRRLKQTGKTPAPSKLREQRERILVSCL